MCEQGSFSAAARQLKRAQSGVSQAIANLEISLNHPLFDRSYNMPSLTEQGAALLPIAKSILYQQQLFDQKVTALAQQQEHELVIAIEESLVDSRLLSLFSDLAEQFPITNFALLSASTFDIEVMIAAGTAQVGIIYANGKMQNEVNFMTLGQNRFVTVVAPSHPLATRQTIEDSELRNCRQLVQRSSQGKELWFSYAISHQLWYASSHQILLQLAEQGIGWAMVPERMAQAAIAAGRLVVLDLSFEPEGWVTNIDCITSRKHQSGPALSAVIALLKAHLHCTWLEGNITSRYQHESNNST